MSEISDELYGIVNLVENYYKIVWQRRIYSKFSVEKTIFFKQNKK